jgi:two-component system chemotaxis response regulator CheY
MVAAYKIDTGLRMDQIATTLHNATGIIVADDDPVILHVLRGMLESIKQDVHLADDGLEAVALASRMTASLIILDLKMPELDGLQACARIRALPGYDSTPIVILTFDDGENAQVAASRAGATMFLVKPFSAAALMLALSRFLPIDDAMQQEIHANAVRASGGRVFRRTPSGGSRSEPA